MASSHYSTSNARLIVAFSTVFLVASAALCFAGNFNRDFDIAWGEGRAKIMKDGNLATLSLDKASGSGIQSKSEYLFGKIDLQIKLVPGNSAGTVTAYYVSCSIFILFSSDLDESCLININFLAGRSCHLKAQHMMRSISSSWEISAATHTFFTQMFTRKEKVTGSSSSTSGSTQLPISIPTPFSGIPEPSCKCCNSLSLCIYDYI